MKNLNQRAARYVFLMGLGFMNVFMFQNCSNWQGQVMVAENVDKLSAEDGLPISDIDLGPRVSDEATAQAPTENVNPPTFSSPAQLDTLTSAVAQNQTSNGAGGSDNSSITQSTDDLVITDSISIQPGSDTGSDSSNNASNDQVVDNNESTDNNPATETDANDHNNADNDDNIADNDIDNQIDDDSDNDGDDDNQFDDTDVYDDNPQFACTRDLAILKIKAKRVLQVINSDSKRKGKGLWIAEGELNDIKLKGRHIILNTTDKTINIRSIKSKGRLVLCGKFNIEKIKSKGRVSFIGADVALYGGKARGKLIAYSASYNEATNKWTAFETDRLKGKISSYGLTAGKFFVDAPIASRKGHNDDRQDLQVSEKHDNHENKVAEVKNEILDRREDKLAEINNAVEERREEHQQKHEDHSVAAQDEHHDNKAPDREEANHREEKVAEAPVLVPKDSENEESFADKIVAVATEIVNKCSHAVETLISGNHDKHENSGGNNSSTLASASVTTSTKPSVSSSNKSGNSKK